MILSLPMLTVYPFSISGVVEVMICSGVSGGRDGNADDDAGGAFGLVEADDLTRDLLLAVAPDDAVVVAVDMLSSH